MKRYINASWNGIVPIKYIVEKLGVSRKEAKEFQNWLYENEYDSGFKSVNELFHTFDISELYNKMKGIKKPSTNKSDKDKENSLRDYINRELSSTEVTCSRFKIDRNNEEVMITLEKESDSGEIVKQDITLPFKIAYYPGEGFALNPILIEVFHAINEMY